LKKPTTFFSSQFLKNTHYLSSWEFQTSEKGGPLLFGGLAVGNKPEVNKKESTSVSEENSNLGAWCLP
jgi:hypothetical protein